MRFGLDGPVVGKDIFKQLAGGDSQMRQQHHAIVGGQLCGDWHCRRRIAGAALRALAWARGGRLYGRFDGLVAEVFRAGIDDDHIVAAMRVGASGAQAPSGQDGDHTG